MPNAKVKIYKKVPYLMSTAAYNSITGLGEVCIIKVISTSGNYFLLTIDNKKYIQNVQGGTEVKDGSIGNCIIREIKEELAIDIKYSEIRHWFLEKIFQTTNIRM
jgi:8-oxo-dGTP pyrophosphatase MutT (NUDIX family)